MTGTEERATREAVSLIREGFTYDEAIRRVSSDFNLSGPSVAEVAKAVADVTG